MRERLRSAATRHKNAFGEARETVDVKDIYRVLAEMKHKK